MCGEKEVRLNVGAHAYNLRTWKEETEFPYMERQPRVERETLFLGTAKIKQQKKTKSQYQQQTKQKRKEGR